MLITGMPSVLAMLPRPQHCATPQPMPDRDSPRMKKRTLLSIRSGQALRDHDVAGLLQGVVFEDDLTVPCHRRASVEIVAALRRYAGSQQRLGRGHGVG